jgi:gliding motility-associated-like protein
MAFRFTKILDCLGLFILILFPLWDVGLTSKLSAQNSFIYNVESNSLDLTIQDCVECAGAPLYIFTENNSFLTTKIYIGSINGGSLSLTEFQKDFLPFGFYIKSIVIGDKLYIHTMNFGAFPDFLLILEYDCISQDYELSGFTTLNDLLVWQKGASKDYYGINSNISEGVFIYQFFEDSIGYNINHIKFDNFPGSNSQNVQHLTLLSPNTIIAAASYGNSPDPLGPQRDTSSYYKSYVLKVDTLLKVQKAIAVDSFRIDGIINNGEKVVLYGKSNAYSESSGNQFDMMVLALDFELNVLWSKIYWGEKFEYRQSELSFAHDGENISLVYSTTGAFPTSYCNLNSAGDIAFQTAYPFYEPDIYPAENGGLVMATGKHFDDSGQIFSKNIIVKTDSIGQLDGCENFSSCIQSLAVTPSLEPLVFTQEIWDTIRPTSSADLLVDSIEINITPFCDIPSPPSPSFSLPTMLCTGETLIVQGSANALAHATAWHLTGPGVDSTLIDSLAFRYVFTQPGTYNLEQTIWYLGCAYSEAHEVEVLPPLELSILPEGPACSPPLQLGLQASRPLQQVQWAHGPTETNITVQNQGWYTVTASDGICTATDSLQVVFVDSLLAGEAPLVLPPDTTVCVQDLPFSLDVASPLADSLLLDGTAQEPPLPLPEAGTYLVSTCLQGCCYSESFILETYDCAPRIYMPTAISPNGDGINDELYPQGKNFTTLSLKVFHRWGGLVHSTEGPAARWDAQDAPTGTYVWLLEYRSHYDGSTQRISGEVMVVR